MTKLQIIQEIKSYNLWQLHHNYLLQIKLSNQELYILAEWLGIKIEQHGGTKQDAINSCEQLGMFANTRDMYEVADDLLRHFIKIKEKQCNSLN